MKEKKKKSPRKKKNDVLQSSIPPDDPTKPWVNDELVLHMAKIDRMESVVYRERLAKMDSLATTKRLQADKLEYTTTQKVLALRKEAALLEQEKKEVRQEYEALLIRIGRKFGLDGSGEYKVNFLQTHGFDSDSGAVIPIEPR